LVWSPKKQKLFLDLVRYDLIHTSEGRELLWKDIESQLGQSKVFSHLDIEQFKLISNWQHFAILELCELENFESDAGWIACQLGISELQATDALQRLIGLGLLTKVGKHLKKTKDCAIKSVPSDAIKRFHLEHLENAKSALKDIPFSERDFSGTTVATNPKQIEKAKKMIQEFRRELTSVLESGPKTRVYHLSVQLFPLNKG
jgi:uncharacterized protein (TIGR02147 family)